MGGYGGVREWVLHGLSLCRAAVNKPSPLRGEVEMMRLRRELEIRQFVIANFDAKLTGSAAVWRDWMIAHAELQIRRYAGEFDDRTFHAEAMKMLCERNEADERVAHLQWMEKTS